MADEKPQEPWVLYRGVVDAMGPLYHTVVEVAGALDDFAVGVNYAADTNPSTLAALRADWDGIMARMGRVEQLLAALPMPEREADPGG